MTHKIQVHMSRTNQRAVIVLPTYNEAGNVIAHLNKIFRATAKSVSTHNTVFNVLVVDDSSPDGTANLVRTYAKKNPRVHLLVRTKKEGLGAAYIHGMQHALATLKPDFVYEMDADGQHNPKDLTRLLAAIQEGADMAIGSRYVNGGSVAKGWGLLPRFKSTAARTVTRIMLNLGSVKDISGGYRAFSASILRKVDWSSLKVKGYAFQAVLLEEVKYQGGIIREIPIAFGTRTSGASKMRLSDMVEGGLICVRIRSKRLFTLRSARRTPARAAKARARS